MSYADDIDPKYSIGGVAAAVGGFGVVKLVGLAAVIHFGIFGLIYFFLKKTKYQPEQLRPLIAFQSAQIGWFAIGALVVPSEAMSVGIDISIGLALLLWLVFTRHWLPLALVCAMQIFGIFVNFQMLSGADYTSDFARPVLVHALLRALIVGAAAYFFYEKHMDGANDGYSETPVDEP
jgi:hypothetical protein